jgi:hypothetical protein
MFEKGQQIRVTGTFKTILGTPLSGANIRLDVWGGSESFWHESTVTNIIGNYWFDITLPDKDTTAIVQTKGWSILTVLWEYSEKLNIGIGVPPQHNGDGKIDWTKITIIGGAGIIALIVALRAFKK